MIPRLLAGLILWSTAVTGVAGSAKILLYHHVSDTTPPSTSVTVASFERHLALLEEEAYRIVPLQQIVDVVMTGGELESDWVAITFDDAYQSVLTEALPRLKKLGWPFTVFVSTDLVDRGYGGYLNWEQLRTLESEGASIANHAVSHEHMVRRQSGESHVLVR